MFRPDQAKVRTYGLVAGRRSSLSEVEARAAQLRVEGWRVRVLKPAADGTLGGVSLPPPYQIKHAHGDGPCERSDRLRLSLEQLHREDFFGVIEFPSLGGWGYRAIQAQRARLAFADVVLTVRQDATSSEERSR